MDDYDIFIDALKRYDKEILLSYLKNKSKYPWLNNKDILLSSKDNYQSLNLLLEYIQYPSDWLNEMMYLIIHNDYYIEMLKTLIFYGADPTYNDNFLLNVAIEYNDIKLLRFLVDANAYKQRKMGYEENINYNPFSEEAMSEALYLASELKHYDIIMLLLEYGADIDQETLNAIFINAVSDNKIILVSFMLNLSEITNKTKSFALYGAVELNNPQMVELLLEYSTDIEKSLIENLFTEAVEKNQLKIVSIFLKKKDIYFDTDYIYNALERAVLYNYIDMVELLLQDPELPLYKSKYEDIFLNAVDNGYVNIVDLMISNNRYMSEETMNIAMLIASDKNYNDILKLIKYY